MSNRNEFRHQLIYKKYPNDIIIKTYKNLLLEYLPCHSGNILDIGCGQGPHIISMIEGDFIFWAIDKDAIAINFLKKRICDINSEYLQKVRITVADLDEIIFDDTLFDGIIMHHFLHFLEPDEYANAIEFFKKKSKPGTIWYIKAHSKKHSDFNKKGEYFQSFFDKEDFQLLFPEDSFTWLYYSETFTSRTEDGLRFQTELAQHHYKGQANCEQLVQQHLDMDKGSEDIEIVVRQL